MHQKTMQIAKYLGEGVQRLIECLTDRSAVNCVNVAHYNNKTETVNNTNNNARIKK